MCEDLQVENRNAQSDRRQFIKVAGAATALGALNAPRVFARSGANQTLQMALIGAGGRGTGAVVDAISAGTHPVKLAAMADLFQHRLDGSYYTLSQTLADKPELVDVPEDRRFV
ncbi:MAG TPA: twin-arginine translocation signal domain-containing protein, partial [Lacipirellula sp.]